MAGKKKKFGLNKKNKATRRQNAAVDSSPPDLNEVLSQADLAMETSDVEQALQLYHYAVITLRESVSASSDTTGEARNKATELMLARALGKFGEAKVSVGDQDGGRSDFNDALLLLDSPDDAEVMPSNEEGHEALESEEWKEAKASICMYLGQLSNGSEALGYFNKAIANLRSCVGILEAREVKPTNKAAVVGDSESDATIRNSLMGARRQLCASHCSVAELYLTDLCDEVDAESKCESYLKTALQLGDNESTPDATQAMANLRLCQSRGVEAIPYILEVYGRMKEAVSAMTDLVGLGCSENKSMKKDTSVDSHNADDIEAKELKDEVLHAAHKLPGFEFRCQTAKILLECASVLEQQEDLEKTDQLSSYPSESQSKIDMNDDTEQRPYCIEAAIQVLGSLLAENDEVVEVWYLLGCAFASTMPKNIEAAKYYWETALELLGKIKKGIEKDTPMLKGDNGEDMQSEIGDVNVQIEELKMKLRDFEGETSNSMDVD